jgi:arabinogalactan oligomer/maltooligosaccharide transport system substrate-binding protein
MFNYKEIKIMKNIKILCVAALGAVALMSVASCGGSSKVYSDVGTEINVWATAKEESVIKKVVETYNANQKDDANKFSYKFTAVSESDAGTTVAKDPTVEGAPALFLCADDHIFNLANKNIALELKGDYKNTVQSSNTAPAVTGATYNEKLYGFPVSNDNGYFLWYNGDAVTSEQAGSLETLLSTAKAAGKKVSLTMNDGWYAPTFFFSPQANGTKSLTYTTDAEGVAHYTVNWDNEVGVSVATYIGNLLKPYYADGTLLFGTNDTITAGFKSGDVIAAVSGTWLESDLKKSTTNLKASKLPEYHINNKAYQMGSFTGSKVYCVNKTRPVAEQKAAAALGDLLTNNESQLVRYEERQTLPCNVEAAKNSRYTENLTISGPALTAQNEFAAIQSQSAQDKYWDIGKAIGTAMCDGVLQDKDKNNLTWAQFLKLELDTIR